VDLDERVERCRPGRHVRVARDARAWKRPRGAQQLRFVDGRQRKPLALRRGNLPGLGEQLRPIQRPLEIRPRARAVHLDERVDRSRPVGNVRIARDASGGRPRRAERFRLVDGWEREALALRGDRVCGGEPGPPERPLEIRPGDRAVDLGRRVERAGRCRHVRNARGARGGERPRGTVRIRRMDGRERETLALRGEGRGAERRSRTERPLEVRPCARAMELDERLASLLAARNVRVARDARTGEHPRGTNGCRLVDGRERETVALRGAGLRGGGTQSRPTERPLAIRPGLRAMDLDGWVGRALPGWYVRISRNARARERSRGANLLRDVDGRKRELLALRGRKRRAVPVRQRERPLEIRPRDRTVGLDGRTERSLPVRHLRVARDARTGKRPRGAGPGGVVDGR
jgi:hypothetical protein